MTQWVGDFETTSFLRKEVDNTSHVWACGLCEVGNPNNIVILKTMDEFITWCYNLPTNDKIYFHNLKFDGNFIVQYLLSKGYQHAVDSKDKGNKTFTTVISDKGLWYQIEVFFTLKGKKVKKVTFQDSLKLIPLSVREIAKSFKMPIRKGSIDYTAHDMLPEGSELTDEEKDYLVHDIQIVETALRFFLENGMNKATIGACALDEYKKLLSKKVFERTFPQPFYDEDVRLCYKGGFTHLNPVFANKIVKNVMVFDVNSLYPSVMAGAHDEILPYGTPIFFRGKYKEDKNYPLYVQKIRCTFRIKKGKIPTIQLKHTPGFLPNVYITHSDGEPVTMYLTSVDLKLFLDHYEILDEIEYLDGWMFKAKHGYELFGLFVDKWSAEKIRSKEEGNHGMYLISKLMLNNLYGKFGTATKQGSRIPYLDDKKLRFKEGEVVEREGVYIAMAAFITAYARKVTIEASQQIEDDYFAGKSKNRWIYSDTDSIHMYSPDLELPRGMDIHPTKLGAWDHEATATKGKFLRQKCYIEEHIISKKHYDSAMSDDDTDKELYSTDGERYYHLKVTVAGMPSSCHKNVTFDNFEIGASYQGKLAHKTVIGGVVLTETEFTIKKM